MIDYTTLVADKTTAGSIKNWVNRSDIPVVNILTEAEAYIYQQLRVREMSETAVMSFATAASTASLPSDFLDPIQFKPYDWSDPMPLIHEDAFQDTRDSSGDLFSGTPSQWTVIGTTMHLNVSVSEASGFSGVLKYYKQPAALSGSNLTNFLTTRYPTMLRRACMKYAYEHMKDTQAMATQEALASDAVFEANQTNELWRRGQEYPA